MTAHKDPEQLQMLVNSMAARSLQQLFPGFYQINTKHHSLYADYGYPEHPTFEDFYRLYKRNGVARAAVERTVNKTWQKNPYLLENYDEVHEETTAERAVRELFERVEFWNKLKEADRRGMVGQYAGIILRYNDGKRLNEPVEGMVGQGVRGLLEVIPLFEPQLKAVDFDMDETSPTYGKPTMFHFNEAAIAHEVKDGNARSTDVHPDRCFVWSRDGTIYGESALEAGLNALLDVEKVVGAGGEGFWKNAKSAPILNVDSEAEIDELARLLDTEPENVAKKMDEVVGKWQKGFDELLMLQGIEAKTLAVTLPSNPEEYVRSPLMVFAASRLIPLKILVGSQSGERASTEDANEWAETIMGRRSEETIPNIMRLVAKLEGAGVIPRVPKGWTVDWEDLTEASASEKVERADKMASINQKMLGRGEVYTPDEIREVTGHEALNAADDSDLDDEDDEEED